MATSPKRSAVASSAGDKPRKLKRLRRQNDESFSESEDDDDDDDDVEDEREEVDRGGPSGSNLREARNTNLGRVRQPQNAPGAPSAEGAPGARAPMAVDAVEGEEGKKKAREEVAVIMTSSVAVVQLPLHDDFEEGTLWVKHSAMASTVSLSPEALADKDCVRHNEKTLCQPGPALLLGVVRALSGPSEFQTQKEGAQPCAECTPLGHAEFRTLNGRRGYWLSLQEERAAECDVDPFITLSLFDCGEPLTLTEIVGCKDDVSNIPPPLRRRYLTTFFVAFMHFLECCVQGEGAMKLEMDGPGEELAAEEDEEEPSLVEQPVVMLGSFHQRGDDDAEGDDDSDDEAAPISGGRASLAKAAERPREVDKKKRAKLHGVLNRALRAFFTVSSKGCDHAKKLLDRPDLRKFIDLHVRMMSPLKWAQCIYLHYYGSLDVVNKNVAAPSSHMSAADLFKYMFDFEIHAEMLAGAMPAWTRAVRDGDGGADSDAGVWNLCRADRSLIYDTKLLHIQRSVVGQGDHPRNLCPLSNVFVGSENPKERSGVDGNISRFTMLRPFRCGTLRSFQCKEDFVPSLSLLRELRYGQQLLHRELRAGGNDASFVPRQGTFSLERKAADAHAVSDLFKNATAAQYSPLDRPVTVSDVDVYQDPMVTAKARELGWEDQTRDRERCWQSIGCDTSYDVACALLTASHDLQEHLASSDIIMMRLMYGNLRWQILQTSHVPTQRHALLHTRIGTGVLDILSDMRLMFYQEGKTHDATDALRVLSVLVQAYVRIDTTDSRQNPFLILTGPPGQGKTDMVSMIVRLLSQSRESKAFAGDPYADQWDGKSSVSDKAMNYEGDLRMTKKERGGTPMYLRDNSNRPTIWWDVNPDQLMKPEWAVEMQALITELATDRVTTHRNEASGELGSVKHRTVGFSRPQLICSNIPTASLLGNEGASRGTGGVPQAIIDRSDRCRIDRIPHVKFPVLVDRGGVDCDVRHEVTSKTMLSNYMETALLEDHTGELLRSEQEGCSKALGFVPAVIPHLDLYLTTMRKMNDAMCFDSVTKLCVNALARASLALQSDAAASGGVSVRQVKRHQSTMTALQHIGSIYEYLRPRASAPAECVHEPGEIALKILTETVRSRVSTASCVLMVGYSSMLLKQSQEIEFDATIRFLAEQQTLSSLISGAPYVELSPEQELMLQADHTTGRRRLEIDPWDGLRTETWEDSGFLGRCVADVAPIPRADDTGSGQCSNFYKRQMVYILPVTKVKSAQANRLCRTQAGSSSKHVEDADLQKFAEMIRVNWQGTKPPVSDRAAIEILRAELKKQQDPSPMVKVQTWVPDQYGDSEEGAWEDVVDDVSNVIPQQDTFGKTHRFVVANDPPVRCDGKSMEYDKNLNALRISMRFLSERIIAKGGDADGAGEHVMHHSETLSPPHVVTVAYALLMMDIAHWVENRPLANLYYEYVRGLPAATEAVLRVQQCASRAPPKFSRHFILAVLALCDAFTRDVFAGVYPTDCDAIRKLFDFGGLSHAVERVRAIARKREHEGATLARQSTDPETVTFPPEWLHAVRTEDTELDSFCQGTQHVHCAPFVNPGGDGNTDCGYPTSGMPGFRTALDELGIAHAEYEVWRLTHDVALDQVPASEAEWIDALRRAGYDPMKERKQALAEGGAVARLRAAGVSTGVHRTCSELQLDAHRARVSDPGRAAEIPVPRCLGGLAR